MYTLKNIFKEINAEESAVNFLKQHGNTPKEKKCDNNHDMKIYVGKCANWRCKKEIRMPKQQSKNNRYLFSRIFKQLEWENKKIRGTRRDFLASYLEEFMWRQEKKNNLLNELGL